MSAANKKKADKISHNKATSDLSYKIILCGVYKEGTFVMYIFNSSVAFSTCFIMQVGYFQKPSRTTVKETVSGIQIWKS